MPSSDQHIAQALHNIQFLESFYKNHQYNDWSITVSFYAVLHIVENAIFLKKNLNYREAKINIEHGDSLPQSASQQNIPGPENYTLTASSPHQVRNILVKENFSEIADFYMLLYRESRNARYKKYHFENNEVNLIVKPSLGKIIEWSNKDFSTSFSLDLS